MTDTTQTRWHAEAEIDGWYIRDDQRWDDRRFVPHSTQEQAEFGAMILNADGLGDIDQYDFADAQDTIEEAILYTNCVRCDETFMQAQLDANKVCNECRS